MNCLIPSLGTVDEGSNWFCSDCVTCNSCANDKVCWGWTSGECFECYSSNQRQSKVPEAIEGHLATNISLEDEGGAADKITLAEESLLKEVEVNSSLLPSMELIKMQLDNSSHSSLIVAQEKICKRLEELKTQLINLMKTLESNKVEFDRLSIKIHNQDGNNSSSLLCSTCEGPATDGYLICCDCKRTSHLTCNPVASGSWVRQCDRTVDDFCCDACLSISKQLPMNMQDSKQKMDVLRAVTSIQRNRLEVKNSVLEAVEKHLDNNMRSFWNKHRQLLVSIIHIAILRLNWFERGDVSNLCTLLDSRPHSTNYPAWLRGRAVRFCSMLRKGTNMNPNRILSKRDNLMNGCDVHKNLLDIDSISTFATMSAAFISITGNLNAPMYITTVAEEIFAKSKTGKDSSSVFTGMPVEDIVTFLKVISHYDYNNYFFIWPFSWASSCFCVLPSE